jgi:hypothetical protein
MVRLLCFGIISCLICDVSLAQDIGVDDYLTGMILLAKPGAGPACPHQTVGTSPLQTRKLALTPDLQHCSGRDRPVYY